MSTLAITLITVALSGALCEAMRRLALRANVLDVPNERSSHTIPIPRGGGIGVATATVFGLYLFWFADKVPLWLLLGMCLPGTAIALLGLFDDIFRLSVWLRLATHGLACTAGFLFLPTAILPGLGHLGAAAWFLEGLLVVTALIWAINLYNFMDGIDGLAGTEAVFVGTALLVLTMLASELNAGLPAAAVAASALGFVALNWPPAKLFMGDSGSGFLGFALGYAGLAAVSAGVNIWSVIIVVGCFVTDATVTLVVRVLRGERAHEAHRSHAYQLLALRWKSHRRVTLLYAGLNLCWLAPLAFLAESQPEYGLWAAAIAYAPLVYGTILAGAGRTANEDSPGYSNP